MLNTKRIKKYTDLKKVISADKIIPFVRHVDKFTCKTRGGDFVRIFELKGVEFQTMSDIEVDSFHQTKKRLFKAINSPRVQIYTNLIHEEDETRLLSEYKNSFCQEVNISYNETYLKEVWTNRYFISVVLKGNTGMEAIRDKIDQGGIKAEQRINVQTLNRVCSQILNDFSFAGIRALEMYEKKGHLFSDPAKLIGRIYNGVWNDQPITKNDLSETIPSVGMFFHNEIIERRGAKQTEAGAILSVRDWEENTNAHQFNDLLSLDFGFILTQSYDFIPQNEAIAKVSTQIKRLEAVDDKSERQMEDLEELEGSLTDGSICLGKFHLTLHTSNKDLDLATHNLERAESILRQGAIIAQRAFLDAEGCFLAQIPGNGREITYSAPITNANFSHFNSFHNFPTGKRYGNHWGDSICTLLTTAGTGYDFNFHAEDAGNTAIYGTVGSGKTLIKNFLLLMSQKFGVRVNLFDTACNSLPFITALGGNYFDLKLNEPSGLAPLQMDLTPKNIQFCKELVQLLVTAINKKLSLSDITKINSAVSSVMSEKVDRKNRTLTGLLQWMPNIGEDNLYERLLMWTNQGEHGWLFDNNEDRLNFSALNNAFNTDNILGFKIATTPIMAYLWHRISIIDDGKPMINDFDEGWQLLDDPFFEEKFKAVQKKGRKENKVNLFETQSPEDSVDTRIHATILQQTTTTIMLSNPKGEWETYKKLKATKKEFEIVQSASKESRIAVIKHDQESVIVDFNLSGISDYFPVLSASKHDLPLFYQCKKEYGAKWLHPYIEGVKNA